MSDFDLYLRATQMQETLRGIGIALVRASFPNS